MTKPKPETWDKGPNVLFIWLLEFVKCTRSFFVLKYSYRTRNNENWSENHLTGANHLDRISSLALADVPRGDDDWKLAKLVIFAPGVCMDSRWKYLGYGVLHKMITNKYLRQETSLKINILTRLCFGFEGAPVLHRWSITVSGSLFEFRKYRNNLHQSICE